MSISVKLICHKCNHENKVYIADIAEKRFLECPHCHLKLTESEKDKMIKTYNSQIETFYMTIQKSVHKRHI